MAGAGGYGGHSGGGGGGGGYTNTKTVAVNQKEEISITVGAANGGKSSVIGKLFEVSANGGSSREAGYPRGADGGSGGGGGNTWYGGSGGKDGSDGSAGNGEFSQYSTGAPGLGQHSTTRAFGESEGTLYCSGGGGQPNAWPQATANTGDGGSAGNGGSGVVIIRWGN